ncbi:MAG: hypothetical protein HFE77_04155 [Clostridiales bacterium]|nr:hypothetical protein [Clostridiales bacterium]
MICKKCGQETNSNDAFCAHCKEPLKKNMMSRALDTLKQMPLRNWLCVIILVLALVIAVWVLAYSFRPGPFSSKTVTITCVEDGKDTVFFYNDKLLEGTFSGVMVNSSTSMYGDLLVFMTEQDELYMVNKKGLYLISNNVAAYRMASYGGGLAYVNSEGELFRFTCKNKKTKQIDTDVLDSHISVSSGGDAIAYLKKEADSEVMYCFSGKKTERYAEDRTPVAVSDGLKHLYTVDGSMNLYYTSGGKETAVFRNVANTFAFDNDFSDILFYADSGSYLFKPGSEATLVSDAMVDLVCSVELASYRSNPSFSMDTIIVSYGIRTFANKFYADINQNLHYVGRKYQSSLIDTLVSMPMVNDKGSRVYYVKDFNLVSSTSKGKTSVLAKGIASYHMTGDGRYLYYMDQNSVLWGKRGNLKAKKIAEAINIVRQSGRDYLFYTIQRDGVNDLYVIRGVSKPKLLCENVSSFSAAAGSAYYEEAGSYYFSSGNSKFKKIYAKAK